MHRKRTLSCVVATLLLTSCSSASSQSVATPATATKLEKDTLSGVFVLHSMSGKGLPYSRKQAGAVYTLHSALIAFQLDGTFSRSTSVTGTKEGVTFPASLLFEGTFDYVASTHAIVLRDNDGLRIDGTVVNDTMTLRDGRDRLVFHRE